MTKPLLEMKKITKSFSGVHAITDIDMAVNDREIRALVGENGAGKSTLMNVLSGVYPSGEYSGEIYFDGEACDFRDIRDSEKLGIVIIHQELALVPELSIAENIFLGNERSLGGVIDWHATSTEAKKLLEKVGLQENPATLVLDIGVGKQQLVEIAKALSKNVRLLILDEPTAALNDEESRKLLKLLKDLREHGITCILISHKLNEVVEVSDSITVIRDGRVIETMNQDQGEFHEDRIIRSMVGREITDRYPDRQVSVGEEVLRVENWNVYHPQHLNRRTLKDVSISVRRGEVVGLAGLMGAGRTELAMSLFGRSWGQKHSGQIYIDGEAVELHDVSEAIGKGLAYVTEDRKSLGLVLIDNIRRNTTLPNLSKVSDRGVINLSEEVVAAEYYRKKLRIKSEDLNQPVESLSGGNQQKVVLGKWLMSQPEVLVLDEPTRGIDVGAKYEVYTVINQLASEGKGLLMISSELPELLGMCDRIYVVNNGEIAGEMTRDEASQENIMRCIMNHQKKARKE